MAQEDHTNWSHKWIAKVLFWGSNDFQFHAAMSESELRDYVVLRFWVIFWEMFMPRDKSHVQIQILSSEIRPRRWNLKELSPIQGELGFGMIWKASPLGFHETSERPFLSWWLHCSSVRMIITLQKVFNTITLSSLWSHDAYENGPQHTQSFLPLNLGKWCYIDETFIVFFHRWWRENTHLWSDHRDETLARMLACIGSKVVSRRWLMSVRRPWIAHLVGFDDGGFGLGSEKRCERGRNWV